MDVTKIPFNSFINIQHSNEPEFLLELNCPEDYLNHVNTIHASAQFALAEATSGEYLLRTFKEYADDIIPVVRKSELKFRKPAEGKIRSKAFMEENEIQRVREELVNLGRAIIDVKVDIFDVKDNLTMQSEFEWFVKRASKK